MEILKLYSKEIVAILAPILTWLLNKTLQPKSKLAWSIPHSFTFLIQEPRLDEAGNQVAPSQTIKTGSILIKNIGKTNLDNIEVVFNWRPILNIWPVRHFEERLEADNRYVMIFDNLSINESIQIEIIERETTRDLPQLLTVRSKQCTAINIQMQPQQIVEAWKVNIAKTLLLIGLGASVYLVIILIQLLVIGTPKVL
ncbi:MAG TPA: hypothetical protein VFF26_07565 [Gallionella sp.]|nr:hypothetical protein [Gallionella sp.]